jgi:NTE family protein
MREAENVNERALVLSGGGVAGIAWMTGLLLGLEDEGVHLRNADIVIGTSAGSTVAAQIAGTADLNDLFLRQVDAARQVAELSPEPQLLEQLSNTLPKLFKLADPVKRGQCIGELAGTTKTVHEAVQRTVIADRLPSHEWPVRPLKVVAVDIKTGEPRIFDRFFRSGAYRCRRCELRGARYLATRQYWCSPIWTVGGDLQTTRILPLAISQFLLSLLLA